MFDCWTFFFIGEYSEYYITKKATFSGDCKQFRQNFKNRLFKIDRL